MTIRLVSAALALFLVAGLVSASDKPVSDDQIYDQVRLKLAHDPEVGGGNIQVEVHQGAVTLKGKVRREKQRQRAEKLAKKVKGVASVTNQLVVSPI